MSDDVFDEMFNDDGELGATEASTKSELDDVVEEKSEAPSQPAQSTTKTKQPTEDLEATHNGVSNLEMKNTFGAISNEFIHDGKSLIEKVEYGIKFAADDKDRKNPLTDTDKICVFFRVPSDFGDIQDVRVNFHRGKDEKEMAKNNLKIKYSFGQYHINDYDTLEKLAKSDNAKVTALINKLKSQVGEDALKVDVYHRQTTIKNGDDENSLIYFTTVNRLKKFNSYSEYWAENGGFPSYPTLKDQMASLKAKEAKKPFECKVLSVNNNTRFNRFEIEVQPVNITDKEYADYVKEKHSFLCTYPYADKDGGVDMDRRLRQFASINDVFSTQHFSEWKSKVGSTVGVEIKSYNSSRADSGQVYRARLK